MDALRQDLRLTFRSLLEKPGFTLVIVLSLALGIGATAAIFSIMNTILFNPLPFAEEERLVRVRDILVQPEGEPRRAGMSAPNFLEVRDQNTVFSGIAAQDYGSFNLAGTEEAERIQGAYVTANMMQVMGVKPLLGRLIEPEEDRSGARARVALIGNDLWHRQFGGDENIIGRPVRLNEESYTIIGVMPRSYRFPYEAELWVPLGLRLEEARPFHYLYTVGRLKPGASKEQAQREMDLIDSRLDRQYPDTAAWKFLVLPVREDLSEGIQTQLLVALLGASGFLLLIACANVANMLLARSLEQSREIAIRSALGASRRRLVQQLLTHGLVLALLSGGLGLLIAYGSLRPLVAISPLAGMSPILQDVQIDLRVIAFTFVVALLVGAFFSLAPAFRASRPDLQSSLKEESRTTASRRGRRLLNTFVVVEVAVAVVLLVGSGLMVKSFKKLIEIDPGYDTRNLLILHLALPESKFPEDRLRVAFLARVLERLAALPGVRKAEVTTTNPMDVARVGTMVSFQDFPPASPEDAVITNHRLVSPGYLETLGAPLLRGRTISEQDQEDSQPVVVISQELADLHWKGQNPIGKRIKRGAYDSEEPWMTVVGVVGDIIDNGEIGPTWYVPQTQHPFPNENVSLVIRTTSDPTGFVRTIRQTIAEIDREQPVYDISSMDELILDSHSGPRFSMLLLTLFAGLGVVLAMVGIYGILTYAVIQQTHEMGLRMALGAQPRHVLQRVLRQGVVLTLTGIVIGLVGALWLTRFLTSLLHEISPTDPATFAVIAAGALVMALLASYLPARKATKVDPLVALRYE